MSAPVVYEYEFVEAEFDILYKAHKTAPLPLETMKRAWALYYMIHDPFLTDAVGPVSIYTPWGRVEFE